MNDPPLGRLRLQMPLALDLKEWVEDRMAPGSIFLSLGHAAELGLGRLADEVAFIAAQCKAKRVPLAKDVLQRLHAAELEAARPAPIGRPAKDAKPGPRRIKVALFASPQLLETIHAQAEPSGPYSESSPVPHAIETGLRVLRAAESKDGIRSVPFRFDGAELWARYQS